MDMKWHADCAAVSSPRWPTHPSSPSRPTLSRVTPKKPWPPVAMSICPNRSTFVSYGHAWRLLSRRQTNKFTPGWARSLTRLHLFALPSTSPPLQDLHGGDVCCLQTVIIFGPYKRKGPCHAPHPIHPDPCHC